MTWYDPDCEHKRTYRTEYGEKCHDCPVYISRIDK